MWALFEPGVGILIGATNAHAFSEIRAPAIAIFVTFQKSSKKEAHRIEWRPMAAWK